jgi:hypothetical protein
VYFDRVSIGKEREVSLPPSALCTTFCMTIYPTRRAARGSKLWCQLLPEKSSLIERDKHKGFLCYVQVVQLFLFFLLFIF